jgi:hypothetical protein
MSYDGLKRRIITGGGDFAPYGSGGHNTLFDYDVVTNTWTLTSGECHLPGQNSPFLSNTDDAKPLIVDLKRNRYVSFPCSTAASRMPATCSAVSAGQPSGSTYVTGVLAQDATTRSWSVLLPGAFPNFPPGVPNMGMHAVWDPVTDLYIGADDDDIIFASPATFQAVHRVPYRFFSTNMPRGVAQPDGRNWWQNELKLVPTFALDVIGRHLYFMVGATIGATIGERDYWGVRLMSIHLDSRTLSLLPTPPVPTPGPGNGTIGNIGGNAPFMVFDTRNRACIFFHTRDECARVLKVYVYLVATGTWETYDVAQDNATRGPPAGSSWVYNADENVCVGGGSEFCADLGEPTVQHNVWLWRYR